MSQALDNYSGSRHHGAKGHPEGDFEAGEGAIQCKDLGQYAVDSACPVQCCSVSVNEMIPVAVQEMERTRKCWLWEDSHQVAPCNGGGFSRIVPGAAAVEADHHVTDACVAQGLRSSQVGSGRRLVATEQPAGGAPKPPCQFFVRQCQRWIDALQVMQVASEHGGGGVRAGSPVRAAKGTGRKPAEEFQDELFCSRKLPCSCGHAVLEVQQRE